MSALAKTDMGPQPGKSGADRERPCYAQRKEDFFSCLFASRIIITFGNRRRCSQTLICSPISLFLRLGAFLLSGLARSCSFV